MAYKTTSQIRTMKLSLIVPIYNESASLTAFFTRVEGVLEKLEHPYEVVCIDDGSTDSSFEQLNLHRKRNPAIKILRLTRNFGKDIALSAGLDHCDGDAVIPLDADLQDPPEVIPELLRKWQEGYEVVFARRESRISDSFLKRTSASLFYWVFNHLTDTEIPPNTGDFRLMDRQVVEALRRIPERNRFMKGIFAWVGYRQAEVVYERPPRESGSTQWNYRKLWNFALDGITSFSTVPLRVWFYFGAVIAAFTVAYVIFLVVWTLYFGIDVPGYASLMVAVLFLGGIQIMSLGVIGEYLGRIYLEVKKRPLYLVQDAQGFEGEPPSNDHGR